jgi:hypothetical protein
MPENYITAMSKQDADPSGTQTGEKKRVALGNVRLRDHHTNEVILIPTPSNDPNDPLNWYVLSSDPHILTFTDSKQVPILQTLHHRYCVPSYASMQLPRGR